MPLPFVRNLANLEVWGLHPVRGWQECREFGKLASTLSNSCDHDSHREAISVAVTQCIGAPWTRKHDMPGSPLFPAVPKTYFPRSLEDLIEICKSRPIGERLKSAGSHWALSTAAVSDTAFIETHDPQNMFPAMGQTRYDI